MHETIFFIFNVIFDYFWNFQTVHKIYSDCIVLIIIIWLNFFWIILTFVNLNNVFFFLNKRIQSDQWDYPFVFLTIPSKVVQIYFVHSLLFNEKLAKFGHEFWNGLFSVQIPRISTLYGQVGEFDIKLRIFKSTSNFTVFLLKSEIWIGSTNVWIGNFIQSMKSSCQLTQLFRFLDWCSLLKL